MHTAFVVGGVAVLVLLFGVFFIAIPMLALGGSEEGSRRRANAWARLAGDFRGTHSPHDDEGWEVISGEHASVPFELRFRDRRVPRAGMPTRADFLLGISHGAEDADEEATRALRPRLRELTPSPSGASLTVTQHPDNITIALTNVMLGPESIGRWIKQACEACQTEQN